MVRANVFIFSWALKVLSIQTQKDREEYLPLLLITAPNWVSDLHQDTIWSNVSASDKRVHLNDVLWSPKNLDLNPMGPSILSFIPMSIGTALDKVEKKSYQIKQNVKINCNSSWHSSWSLTLGRVVV